ncbi:MAG: hypothetical protein ACXU98_08295, partial [Syntrophales bacterium]
NFSVDYYAKTSMIYKDQSETDKFVNALRKAGLKREIATKSYNILSCAFQSEIFRSARKPIVTLCR